MIERILSPSSVWSPTAVFAALTFLHSVSEPAHHQMPLINKQPYQATCLGTAIAISAINRLGYSDSSMIATPHRQSAVRVQRP
jgi:hypothetical protein